MAKKQIDTIGIRFDATEAINDAEKLKDSLKGMGDRYKYVCDQLKDVSNLSREAVSALEKEKTSLEKSMSSVAKLVDNAITQLRNIDDILSDLSGAKFNELTRARNAQALRLKRISPDMEGYEEELEMFRRVNREIELRNKSFREMSEEEREALKITRDLIVANAERFSVSEIQNAIKFTKELRDLEKIDSDEYKRYQQEADALQEVLDLNKKLAEEKERQNQLAARQDVLDSRDLASVEQLKEAIKLTQELRDKQAPSSTEYAAYEEEIKLLQEQLDLNKKIAEEKERQDKLDAREATLRDKDNASVEQLKEAIKLTQELRDAKAPSSAAYSYYQQEIDALQEVLDLNKKLAEEKAKQDALQRRQDVLDDPWNASVDQLKEALKLTEQLRDATTDSWEREMYKEEAENLQKVIDKTKELSMAEQQMQEHRRQLVVNDPTKASVDQLKEAIKLTEKLRDTKPIDSNDYKLHNDELTKLKDTLKGAEQPIKNIALSADEMNNFLKSLSSQPLEKLEQVASQLEEELNKMAPDTKEFIEESQKLRIVNGRIKDLKEEWQEHDGQIVSTIKRLSSYVAVYGSYNFVAGKIKEFVSSNLELSDSLSDIQKTTALTGESLRRLSLDIDAIDTRTSQEALHQLAATAGQMGISARTEVLGFVKASNQLNVALNELGEDGVLALSKIVQLTGDVERMGIEKSLLSIGSSINELSANSSASAGPIADFIRRVGGLAPVAKLATSDLAALGATADALGQPIEVAGTAMNKFIMSLVTNTEDIAYALNLDVKELKGLIDTGRTMEAIIKVLGKVRSAGAEGGAALNGIFKELGSEGARMTQVISAMAQNTSFLQEQVSLSAKAFYEATSATQEYNVKNENAAAIWERIGNTFREAFTNANYTNFITDILKAILKLTQTLFDASNAGLVMRNVLHALLVQIVAVGTGLNKFVYSLFVTKQGTISLTQAWQKFNLVLKKNAFGLIVGAIWAVINVIRKWNQEQKALTAHVNELTSALNEEKEVLKKVNDELKRVKGLENAREEAEARADLIKKINREYGTYLNHQLNEAAGYNEIAEALKLVNEQLDLKYAKQIFEKRMEKATDTYTSKTASANENLVNVLSQMPTVGEKAMKTYGELLAVIKKIAIEGEEMGTLSTAAIWGNWETLAGILSIDKDDLDGNASKVQLYLSRIYNAEVDYIKARRRAMQEENANVVAEEEEVAEAQEGYVAATRQRMEEMMRKPIEPMSKEELHEHYKTILEYGDVLIAAEEKKFASAKAELDKKKREIEEGAYTPDDWYEDVDSFDYDKELKKISEPLEVLRNSLQPIEQAYEGDAWSKALNIPGLHKAFGSLENLNSASVDNLVQTYKALQDAGKKYTTADLFNAHFGTEFKTRDEVLKYLKESAGKVKEQLKMLGYTTSGNFDWSTEKGRSEAEKEAKRQFEAAKAALKAYYEEQETIIKQAYIDRQITHEEMTRRISKNEQEQSEAFVDLYSVLLGEAKKYDTNIEKILKGKDLQKLGGFLRKFGPAMVDGMRLGMQQSEGAIRDEAIKLREIIDKALLEGDMFGKLEDDFRSMLDNLSLLTTDFGKTLMGVDDATAVKLVSQLTKVADKAYTITKKDLLDASEGDETLTAFWTGATDEQLTLIFEKLKNYYDSVLDMQKRYADRVRREWEQMYKQTGQQALYEANKQFIESASGEPEGYVKGAGDYNRERGVIKAKAALEGARLQDEIAAHQKRLSTLAEGSNEYISVQALIAQQTTELNAIIQQSEIDTTQLTIEQWQKRAEAAGEWAELIGESFTEVAILNKRANEARVKGDEETAKELEAQAEESRQNAIKAALNKTIDMAKVWAMELGLKIMYNSLAQKSDEETAAAGAQASLKDTLATIIAQGFKAAGKEIGSKGIAGLLTGAAVIAAAAGLAAVAKTAVANMYPEAAEGVSEAAASAPKRKLTTGTLTYAEGKYPVLGNDGVVYDAEYAGSNIKTGVYRKPHFGIFAEKQPEMVIDGKTTQRLVLNYPEVYSGILELSRTGRMGMRTYATGNVLEIGEGYDAQAHQAQQQAQMEEMRQTMAATAAALAALTRRLDQPIHAEMNYFGKGGAREAEQRGSRWAVRNRVR